MWKCGLWNRIRSIDWEKHTEGKNQLIIHINCEHIKKTWHQKLSIYIKDLYELCVFLSCKEKFTIANELGHYIEGKTGAEKSTQNPYKLYTY